MSSPRLWLGATVVVPASLTRSPWRVEKRGKKDVCSWARCTGGDGVTPAVLLGYVEPTYLTDYVDELLDVFEDIRLASKALEFVVRLPADFVPLERLGLEKLMQILELSHVPQIDHRFTIRPADPQTRPFVRELLALAILAGRSEMGQDLSVAEARSIIAGLETSGLESFVAWDDSRPIGHLTVLPAEQDEVDESWYRAVFDSWVFGNNHTAVRNQLIARAAQSSEIPLRGRVIGASLHAAETVNNLRKRGWVVQQAYWIQSVGCGSAGESSSRFFANRVESGISLAFLREALGKPASSLDETLAAIVSVHGQLGPLLLSVAAFEHQELSREMYERIALARRKALDQALIRDSLNDVDGLRVLKGSGLASLYPHYAMRTSDDIDLIVHDPDTLWRTALSLIERFPVSEVLLTLVDKEIAISLFWRPADAIHEEDHRTVEISTVAYFGDLDRLPIRTRCPENVDLANLIAIAEERFQRPFSLRDAIDVGLLAKAGAISVSELLSAAVEYCISPELAELIRCAASFGTAGQFVELLPSLRGYAASEFARREMYGPSVVGDEAASNSARLYGVRLGPLRHECDGRSATRIVTHGVEILDSPIGFFLLSPSVEISQESYARAVSLVETINNR